MELFLTFDLSKDYGVISLGGKRSQNKKPKIPQKFILAQNPLAIFKFVGK